MSDALWHVSLRKIERFALLKEAGKIHGSTSTITHIFNRSECKNRQSRW